MKKTLILSVLAVAIGTMATLPAAAQNLAIVNGKAVPSARMDALVQQVTKSGRPVTPEMQGQIKDEVITREIFTSYFARGYRAVEFFLDRPSRKGAYMMVRK